MSTAARSFSVVFGVFLVGVGVYVALLGGVPWYGSALAAIVLIALGGNLVYSAVRSRRSWLSRIGPLP
jgi:hypothetical protein